MVIGVDGAASHLSAAFGGKNLTLFFRTNPHNWHFATEKSVALLAQPGEDADEENPEYELEDEDVVRAAVELLRA